MTRMPLAAALITVAALLAVAHPVVAAQPIPGGRYEGKTAALTIADDGASLAPEQKLFTGAVLLQSAVRYPPCGGLSRRGKLFRGAVRIEQNESGDNGNGTRYLTYEVYYGSGEESWNYYTSGPRKGRWSGPYGVIGSRLAELYITNARSAAPLRVADDGSFALELSTTGARSAHLRLELQGKFATASSAVGRLRVWTRLAGGGHCDTRWRPFRDLRYTGERHVEHGPCDSPATTLASAPGLRIYAEPFRVGGYGWDGEDEFGRIRSVAILCSDALQLRRMFDIERSESESVSAWAMTPSHFAQFGDYNCDSICIPYLAVNPFEGSGGRMAGNCETTPPACDVKAFVLAPSGAIAWTDQTDRKKIVAASMSDGKAVTLDSGAGVDLASLALDGATVRWTNAGRARSAELH